VVGDYGQCWGTREHELIVRLPVSRVKVMRHKERKELWKKCESRKYSR